MLGLLELYGSLGSTTWTRILTQPTVLPDATTTITATTAAAAATTTTTTSTNTTTTTTVVPDNRPSCLSLTASTSYQGH